MVTEEECHARAALMGMRYLPRGRCYAQVEAIYVPRSSLASVTRYYDRDTMEQITTGEVYERINDYFKLPKRMRG